MLAWLTGRTDPRHTADELYGRVVAAARQPVFYGDLGVPDTPEGRYELVALHLFLGLERLRLEGARGETVSRLALEAFVTDMDDCMREMGVGDLTVPKRVKRAAAGFYERAGVYRAGLDAEGWRPMAVAVNRYVFNAPDAPVDGATGALAVYARHTADALAKLSANDVLAGRVTFLPFSTADAAGVS